MSINIDFEHFTIICSLCRSENCLHNKDICSTTRYQVADNIVLRTWDNKLFKDVLVFEDGSVDFIPFDN